MKTNIHAGVYPVMLTPFFEDLSIDWEGLKRFTEWFVSKGCQGLFAVCGSSEMTLLTLDERIRYARTVVETVGDRDVDIVASGHCGQTIDQQIEEIQELIKTGIDSFILVSGRLANPYQDDRIFLANLERILAATGDATFGIYECPSPYNRQLAPEVMRYLADTGRFTCSKDTSCSYAVLNKIAAVKHTDFKVFNAFAPLTLTGCKAGGKGYSGIHANYFPDLFVRLWSLFEAGDIARAERLQGFITTLSRTEMPYNIGTKYYLNEFEGVQMAAHSRSDNRLLHELEKEHLRDYFVAVEQVRALFG